MTLSEQLQDLDPKIAAVLRRAVEELRAEFRELLDQARGSSDDRMDEATPVTEPIDEALHTEPLAALEVADTEPPAEAEEVEETPEAEATPAPEVLGREPLDSDDLEELKHAVCDVDRSTSQGQVLEALLAGARRFASRSAVFVLRSGALEGWEGSGFEGAVPVQSLELRPPEDSPWNRVGDGRGGVPLEASDCALLCDAVGAQPPAVGILLPLVLGDQVAAALYADRLTGEGSLQVSALQLLTYSAGQVLETLPLRNRDETSTLRIAQGAAPTAVPADDAVEEAEPAEALEEIEVSLPADEEPQEVAEPTVADAVEEESLEAEVEEPPSIEPLQAIEGELVTRTVTAPEPFQPTPEPSPEETTDLGSMAAPPGEELEEWPAPDNLFDGGQELTTPAVPGAEEPSAPSIESAPSLSAEPTPEVTAEETMEPEARSEPQLEARAESALEPEPIPEAPTLEPTGPEMHEASPEATVPVEAPEAAPPAEAPEPPAEPSEARSTTEVRPPSDVDGPGWAFTQRPTTSELGDEALHEEARRLARLLVTEIKLYNEEQVDTGRQHRDLRTRLREDIERSRQIYADRIDSSIREKKDYFHEALVRILAGGDAGALGA